MDLVKLLEAFRERCAKEAEATDLRQWADMSTGATASEAGRFIREIDVAAWLASQPALDVGPRCGTCEAPRGTNGGGCDECETVESQASKIRVCVAALVTDPLGRLLLVRSRRREGWEMPGGKKMPGEAWRTAVVREVFEETGVRVRIVDYEAIDAGPNDGLSCESLVIMAWCSAPSGDPKAGSDAVDARWFSSNALPELAALPTARILREWAVAW